MDINLLMVKPSVWLVPPQDKVPLTRCNKVVANLNFILAPITLIVNVFPKVIEGIQEVVDTILISK